MKSLLGDMLNLLSIRYLIDAHKALITITPGTRLSILYMSVTFTKTCFHRWRI
ncbi:MAG: hypothetical protein MjAS7_2185 [Metallosphaera javensis (ex Sakai et al. 2022)]|nr:MAG: hypothetical protein MjAS7_2185 [Metallosphaera javensis (ex Sakai et al. 2022)]